jgi:ammonia channel protein AmtB
MEEGVQRLVRKAAWFVPLAWVMSWALFRGAYAHGGYLWWQTVHVRGGLVLLVAALIARTVLWRRQQEARASGAAFGAGQVALVAVVVVASWLCFQTGLAYHCPPTSVAEFFWQDP